MPCSSVVVEVAGGQSTSLSVYGKRLRAEQAAPLLVLCTLSNVGLWSVYSHPTLDTKGREPGYVGYDMT